MAALKDELGPAAATRLAAALEAAWPDFPRRRFTHGLAAALESLELMARSDLLADRLAATLPPAFAEAADVVWAALRSPSLDGWIVLPCGTFVARAGIDDPERALALLAGLTPRFSSEFAIRAFVEAHPGTTYAQLASWCDDPDEHVRRLVSEGTRPRLPWASLLRGLIADPAPNLPLLERLVDDPSPYVRRSVANHLNDISRDHPALALDLARGWVDRGEGPAWVVRHGLRTLVKRGDPEALAVLGVATDVPVELVDLVLAPSAITIGEEVVLRFSLRLADGWDEPADVVVDYRVHHQGARGPNAPKVFELTRRRLVPGEVATIERRHRFAHVSIRRIRPGPHPIDVQLNGRVAGTVVVEIADPDGATATPAAPDVSETP